MEIHQRNITRHVNSSKKESAHSTRKEGQASPLKNHFEDEFKFIPKPFRDAAQGIEQQFVEFMVEQMHKTAQGEEQGTALDYYNDLLHRQESEKITKHKNGLGIQKIILDQIYPKKFRNKEALMAFNAQASEKNKKTFIRTHQPIQKEKSPSQQNLTMATTREGHNEHN